MSEIYLPKLVSEYNICTEKLSLKRKELEEIHAEKEFDSSKKKEKESEINSEIRKIQGISDRFSMASFGLEHIFRELSQIYESYQGYTGKIPEVVSNLPKIMAELILKGNPLEIMDGNVSHVPILWLEKVFQELQNLMCNLRVYVTSILGIQSSGKSTFLNTMHGSKFAVSSGRCTKGIFIQLLPVKEEYKKRMKCDYYMIMDSEGLRSPELGDSFHHDNEIATLITCLANTTIINFWGQTFSKDMADVIEIAAHAYIRMKTVKINSSFHMVFAGVSDITAEERNKLGVSRILNELNDLILKIARKEGRMDLFNGLQSIFPMLEDLHTNLVFPKFLPALWQGSMSPPESSYGELVQELKESMAKTLTVQDGKNKKSNHCRVFK